MKSQSIVQRRQFLKTITCATASSTLVGRAWTQLMAAEIKPMAQNSTGILRVNLQDFPALMNELGSVRLKINPLSGNFPDGPFYPVIINRDSDDTFHALNSRCTHQNCVVPTFDSSNNRMTCPCHFSQYAIDGRRISGPAPSDLTKYNVTFDGENLLEVEIPQLGYQVNVSKAENNGRFRLSFTGIENVEYEVLFRERLGGEPTTVPFSLDADGPIDQMVHTASDDSEVNLYVDGNAARGFFMVSIRTAEV
jgi:Rieske Fe-S protein